MSTPNGLQSTVLLTFFFSIIIKPFWEMSMIKHVVEWKLGRGRLEILTVPSLMLLAQKKHHIHSLQQITPPFLDRCPVAVKPCLRLSPLAKGVSYPSLGRHLMHTGYRSIQSGKIYHRYFFSNLAKLHTNIFFLGEEHLRTTPAKGIF